MKREKAISPKRRTFIDLFRIYGSGAMLAIIILVICYQFVEPAPPLNFTIATGSKSGVYYSTALKYQKFLAKQGINLNIIETKGSEENLEILARGESEVAFVQGGTGDIEKYPDFQGLASLYFEPLFILVRKGKAPSAINQMQGSRIVIGEDGSGTQKISRQVLMDNGLTEENATLLPWSFKKGTEQLIAGQIDAVFLVSGAASDTLADVLQLQDIQLFSLKRAAAYTRHHSYLSYVILPEGGLDLATNIPPEDTRLIAPAATLVIKDGLHPALIDQLLQACDSIHDKNSLLLSDSTFPNSDYLDFPLSKEAARYFKHGPPFLQRYLPFWAATLVDRLKVMLLPLIALLLPIMKILPPTYQWRIRSRVYRWYEELHNIDLHWNGSNDPEIVDICLRDLERIENEVRQVEVPLSYAKELYTLRNHIDMLYRQIQEERT